MNFFLQHICNNSDHPDLFIEYFNYINNLDLNDNPNYDDLVDLFASALTTEQLENHDHHVVD